MSIEDTTGSEGDWKGGQDNLSALGVMKDVYKRQVIRPSVKL